MARSPSLGPWELPDYHNDTFTLRQMGEDHKGQGGGDGRGRGSGELGWGVGPGFLGVEGLKQDLGWVLTDRT